MSTNRAGDGQTFLVRDEEGTVGVVEGLLSPADVKGEMVDVRLSPGRTVSIPKQELRSDGKDAYLIRGSFSRYVGGRASATHERDNKVVIPIVEEQIDVDKRWVEAGGVRVTKHVREREELIEEPLLREGVRVERVPVNRYVDTIPEPRIEGNATVIPVVEEVLVVQKRLLVKEEVRVSRERTQEPANERVILKSQDVDVERLAPEPPADRRRE